MKNQTSICECDKADEFFITIITKRRFFLSSCLSKSTHSCTFRASFLFRVYCDHSSNAVGVYKVVTAEDLYKEKHTIETHKTSV